MIATKWKPGDTVTTACQEWQGATATGGYGHRTVDGQDWKAHRYVIHEIGHDRWGRRLDHGEVVMHLCDNSLCIRFDHLRVGSFAENMADMVAKGRCKNQNSDKTHCPQDHPYSDANTYVNPSSGRRTCRSCQREHLARHRANKKANQS